MSVDEAIAACCAIPTMKAREHRVAIGKTGQEVSPKTDPKQLIEPPFLRSLTCGGAAGMIDVGFSFPPSSPRVVQVHDKAFGEALHTTPDGYLHDLIARYGKPVDHGATEPIDPARGSSAVTYKWLFRKNAADLDCAPRSSSSLTFESALPHAGQCATQVVVRIASEPGHVIAADFALNNLRNLAEGYDQHIRFLNKTNGLSLPEGGMTAALSPKPPSPPSAAGPAATQDSTDATLAAAFLVLLSASLAQQANSGGGSTIAPPRNTASASVGPSWNEMQQQRVEECRRNCENQKVFCMMGSGPEAAEEYQECESNSNNNISRCTSGCY
jgi:hypothetical protein